MSEEGTDTQNRPPESQTTPHNHMTSCGAVESVGPENPDFLARGHLSG